MYSELHVMYLASRMLRYLRGQDVYIHSNHVPEYGMYVFLIILLNVAHLIKQITNLCIYLLHFSDRQDLETIALFHTIHHYPDPQEVCLHSLDQELLATSRTIII